MFDTFVRERTSPDAKKTVFVMIVNTAGQTVNDIYDQINKIKSISSADPSKSAIEKLKIQDLIMSNENRLKIARFLLNLKTVTLQGGTTQMSQLLYNVMNSSRIFDPSADKGKLPIDLKIGEIEEYLSKNFSKKLFKIENLFLAALEEAKLIDSTNGENLAIEFMSAFLGIPIRDNDKKTSILDFKTFFKIEPPARNFNFKNGVYYNIVVGGTLWPELKAKSLKTGPNKIYVMVADDQIAETSNANIEINDIAFSQLAFEELLNPVVKISKEETVKRLEVLKTSIELNLISTQIPLFNNFLTEKIDNLSKNLKIELKEELKSEIKQINKILLKIANRPITISNQIRIGSDNLENKIIEKLESALNGNPNATNPATVKEYYMHLKNIEIRYNCNYKDLKPFYLEKMYEYQHANL
jgi:hypothetical protein